MAWTKVTSLRSQQEAELFAGRLRAAGIKAKVRRGSQGALGWLSATGNAVDVAVVTSDRSRILLLVPILLLGGSACRGSGPHPPPPPPAGIEELRERLRGIEPLCDSDYTPDGFAVTEGEAIALAVGKRQVSCDLVETEPMDNETWAVHVDARPPNGCEFSAEVDGNTGEVSNRFRDCG